jgi:hypothetical protein
MISFAIFVNIGQVDVFASFTAIGWVNVFAIFFFVRWVIGIFTVFIDSTLAPFDTRSVDICALSFAN